MDRECPASGAVGKRGDPVSQRCAAKLDRLKTIVARHDLWKEAVRRVRRMHSWLLEVEHILGGPAPVATLVTNQTVGAQLDAWCVQVDRLCRSGTRSDHEHRCGMHVLQVTRRLRPWLGQWHDTPHLPRTNNAMEGFIRRVKARARRMSGRKRWNQYLLRYGIRVVYDEAHVSTGTTASLLAAIRQ